MVSFREHGLLDSNYMYAYLQGLRLNAKVVHFYAKCFQKNVFSYLYLENYLEKIN